MMDLPVQLGYSILQYAKLHMLMFYYDILLKFVDEKDFEYLEMDTDSAYFALSKLSLNDSILPSMKDRFLKYLHGNCTGDYKTDVGKGPC